MDPRGFWDLIASGGDAIGDIPPDRWRAGDYFDADPSVPGRMFVRQGGFLDTPVDEFDAGFFGMSPREAAALDPQQRLLLEVTWEGLEDAGIPPSSTATANVGAYIGGFTFDAATLQLTDANQHLISSSTPTGVSMTMLAARLSYTFDWRGPSLTLDTACSSSLVALHHAVAALARGDCDLAVAGGVNVMVNPVTTILMSKGQFLSPDARCKSFDHRANGYARGEGAAILVLKPLSSAERDGDHVHAIVRGTAVNHDGRTPGITVPSVEAQRVLIRRACQAGDVEPASVAYFEAHGTGTAVGDPIEATAIGEVLGGSTETHWMGSVKSNFGHTEAAAGVAGVIKAAMCLERGVIPPNVHFERPNPRIPFDRLPLRVPTELVPFPEQAGPRRAGVNSFGFGGTNAHAILEQSPTRQAVRRNDEDDGRPVLLPLSARSPQALRSLADSYATLLKEAPPLARIARAASRQRDHHPIRTFVVAADAAEATEKLREITVASRRTTRPVIAFVYTGMGPQWWGMGRELLEEQPRFDEVVAACDEVLARFDLSIGDELRRDENETRLTSTLYAQVANFVVQAGITALWRDWGIEPGLVVGHSAGEITAAYAAGVYSLEDALTVSFHRARLQAGLAGRGVMAAVDVSADEVAAHLPAGVEIAAVNSAHATTLAGDREAVAVATETLTEAGASVRRLAVEVAYHSHQMDEIREPLIAALRDIRPRRAEIPLFSTVTGHQVEGPGLHADYWWRNVREPVRFADAFRRVLTHSPGAVLEIGPHPVLASAIDEALAEHRTESTEDTVRLASLRRDRPQRRQLLESLGQLYEAGADPAWDRVHPGPREHLDLPRYPWQRARHWTESAASREKRLGSGGLRLGGRTVTGVTPTRDVELSASAFPYLGDHRIGESVVFPGSGYLETALAAFPDDEPCFLDDIVFHRPLALPPSSITTLRAGYDPSRRLLTLHSRGEPDDATWTLHAELRRAHVARARLPRPRTETLAELTEGLPELDHEEVYTRLTGTGLNYGPAFRAVRRLWWRKETREVLAELMLDTVEREGHRLHPVLLDAALQAVIAGALMVDDETDSGTYVPARIDTLRFFRSPGTRLWVHGRGRGGTVPGRIECDLSLVTDGGEVVAEVRGLRARRLAEPADERSSLVYEHGWQPEPLERANSAEGRWIVVGASATATELARRLVELAGEVVRTATNDDNWLEQVLSGVVGDRACRGVVHVDDASHPSCASVAAPLRLVQELPGGAAPLFLITTGAQSVSDDDPTTTPAAAALWGFGRVVAAERPELRCRLVDVTPGDTDALVTELTHDGLDDVALRPHGRYVRRLTRADEGSALDHVRTRTDVTPVCLRPDLRFVATTRRPPGPGEVELEISHVGLNFKDVLKQTGLIAPHAIDGSHSGESLGLECSGTVVDVGEGVTEPRVGDSVFAHGRDLFTSHATLDAVRVARKPATLSGAQAASLLPVVTAYLSLVRLADVRRGERVLVHSAAGGVGLAAARIATWLGAAVFVTAGSEQRRDFLRREGFPHVADSRSSSFADDVLEWTGGAGVDVIVNSLPADMIHHSLGVLSTFGRFVELGKPGDVADHAVRLASTRRALSFHSFDYDQMMALAPEDVRSCMRAVADLHDRNAITPLPLTEMPAEEVGEAFRAMTRPEHRGKIVVRMAREPVTVPATSIPGSPIRPDATYLLTGGLGGLGLTVALWLTDNGARHLVLVGRRGVTTSAAARVVADLTARGVEVRIEKADVGDPDQVRSLFARVRAELPPIGGIVHAAADFDDAVLADTDATRLIEATRPKADGAWHLHRETLVDDLDFFVLFSSVAAQLGAVGAGAYATANEFLNGLARYRRAQGLPATSVGWGMVDEVGVAVSRDGHVGDVLRRSGHVGMSPARFVGELGTLLRTRPAEVSVADVDWSRWSRANPQLASLPRFRALVPAAASDGDDTSVAKRLKDASPADRTTMLPALVTPLLRRTTGLTDHQLGERQSVDVDSLTAVELRVLVQKHLGVTVPAVRLQRSLSVEVLTDLVAGELDRTRPETAVHLTTHEIPTADGLVIHGHLSLPAGPGPHPAVVVCPAGEGGALDADGDHAHVSEHAPLRAAGFAVLTVDQRGAPGHVGVPRARMDGDVDDADDADDADDVVTAARYLAALPEVDGTRVGVLGTSRGAFTALLALARQPDLWRHGVLLMGLYDPAVFVATERTRPGSLLPAGAEISLSDLAAYFAAPRRQPLTALADVAAPLLILHGDADPVVPLAQSEDLAARVWGLGLPAHLITVPGLTHDSDHEDPVWADLWPEISRFLKEGDGARPPCPDAGLTGSSPTSST